MCVSCFVNRCTFPIRSGSRFLCAWRSLAGLFAGHDYMDGLFDIGLFGVKAAADEFGVLHQRPMMVTYRCEPSDLFL